MQQTIKLNSKNQILKKEIFHWIASSSNLVADRGVLDGVEGGGVAAVDPTLLEVPEGWDNEVIPPGRGEPIVSTTGFKVDGITDELQTMYVN